MLRLKKKLLNDQKLRFFLEYIRIIKDILDE